MKNTLFVSALAIAAAFGLNAGAMTPAEAAAAHAKMEQAQKAAGKPMAADAAHKAMEAGTKEAKPMMDAKMETAKTAAKDAAAKVEPAADAAMAAVSGTETTSPTTEGAGNWEMPADHKGEHKAGEAKPAAKASEKAKY